MNSVISTYITISLITTSICLIGMVIALFLLLTMKDDDDNNRRQ